MEALGNLAAGFISLFQRGGVSFAGMVETVTNYV